ncbi:MAG: flavodoxin [Ktedonobacteraceae bacterium]
MGKLFFGTQTGTSEGVAHEIQSAMPDLIQECKNIYSAKPAELEATDFLVLGGSTWGDGELTDDWADFLPQMKNINLAGKKVALFALGDQIGYSYNFVSSMKILYDRVIQRGADVIATDISTDGFEFDHSEAIVGGKFVGLVVDEVNEPELTKQRIKAWEAQIRSMLGVLAA